MKGHKLCIVATFGLLAFTGVSEATTLGLSREGKYAIWDSFSLGNTSYNNLAPSESSSGFNASLFLVSTPDGEDFGGQGDFFNHATGEANWYISGQIPLETTELTLQIKMSTADTSYFWPVLILNAQYHSPSTTTVAGTGEFFGDDPISIITWTWSNPDFSSHSYFSFDFSTLAGGQNVAIDAIAVNAISPIPEPATWLSMATGLGLLVGCRRLLCRRK